MFLTNIFTKNNDKYKSGIVKLTIPKPDGSGNEEEPIIGLVDQDIAFKMSTSWGSVIPDLGTAFSDFSQIVNSQNILSWVSASTTAWKGTEPFQFDLTFYLVTYKYGQTPSIMSQAKKLASLCALYTEDGSSIKSLTSVKVHGGYTLNLMDSNVGGLNSFLDTQGDNKSVNLNEVNKLLNKSQGLITMELGNIMKINKLLLNNVTVTPSSVQVEDKVPLYIKIDASFRTHRALLVGDLDEFFGD